MTDLFEPLTAGAWTLPNRVVMAPLTRNRSKGTVPGDLAVEYYAQRASAGLIITEGSQPSARGQGYLDTPGFHSPEQLEGWRRVAEAVHANGGRIVAQLMHAGRISHPDNTGGQEIIAPSAIAAPGQIVTPERPAGLPDAARHRDRRDPRGHRGVRQRRPQRGGGRPRRRRGARRQRLPDPPVPGARLQRAHRRVRRVARQPRPLRDRGREGRRRRDRRRPGRPAALAGAQHPGRDRGGPRRRRGDVRRRDRGHRARSAWPT